MENISQVFIRLGVKKVVNTKVKIRKRMDEMKKVFGEREMAAFVKESV